MKQSLTLTPKVRPTQKQGTMTMKLTEQKVTEQQMDEVVDIILRIPGYLFLNANDVREMLTDRTGVLYRASKEPCEDNRTFVTACCSDLLDKEQIQNSQYMLVNIGSVEGEELTMEDMVIIQCFLQQLGFTDLMRWGFYTKPMNETASIEILCTNDIDP